MAAFTSTQSGNWNDGATWGNTSPGTKGTDWPGLAGDTATVSSGHTVVYNVYENNGLGRVTLNGKLSFDRNASRRLVIKDADLAINSNGELEIGTETNNFPKEYTAEILFDTSSDNARGFYGYCNVYGASDYCSVYEDTLANDAENTDGDTDIKTVNDMSSIWHVGDELIIRVKKSYGSPVLGIIQGFGTDNIIHLDINVTADSDIGNTWTAYVINVTRNVKFGKLGASTDIGNHNENRPYFRSDSDYNDDNNIISHAMFTGFWRVEPIYNFKIINSTIRNGKYGFYYNSVDCYFSGNMYSLLYGFGASYNCKVNGNIFNNSYAFTYMSDNSYGIDVSSNYEISGKIFNNNYTFYKCNNYKITDAVISGNNTAFYSINDFTFDNVDYEQTGNLGFYTINFPFLNVDFINCNLDIDYDFLFCYPRNRYGYVINVNCENYNKVLHAHKIFSNMGDIIKTACDGAGDAPSVDPDGGNDYCIELSNIQSNCNQNNPLQAINPKTYRIWATGGVSKTYTFKVQTTYTSGISSGNLKLTARYLDGTGNLTETTNAPTINTRTSTSDWSQTLTVTVNPAQDGWVDFKIELMQYEANGEVYIWPNVTIS